jgi:succinate dehydrogenase/fumarate reductase flavoprotein subunit
MLKTHQSTPTAPVWLICDAAFIYKYGLGAIHPGTRKLNPFVSKKWLVVADSIKDLALAINVPGQALAATIERHNQFAATGVDLDFSKGSTQLNQYNGDPSHKPNPCIGPLVGKIYCAMAVWPAELGTSTGLETDQHGRVLNQQEMPIDGLYVCGNDMSSIMRGTYPGPGTTLGPALVFGHLAAVHAVTQK